MSKLESNISQDLDDEQLNKLSSQIEKRSYNDSKIILEVPKENSTTFC